MAVPFQKHTSRSVLRHQLNDVIPEYRTYLENQDLAPSWIDTLVETARHIVRWLSFNGIEIEALDIRKIADFMSHDCTCPSGFQSHVRRSRGPPPEKWSTVMFRKTEDHKWQTNDTSQRKLFRRFDKLRFLLGRERQVWMRSARLALLNKPIPVAEEVRRNGLWRPCRGPSVLS